MVAPLTVVNCPLTTLPVRIVKLVPIAGTPAGGKEAQLAVAGAWKDDPLVEEELREIYRRRGRSLPAEKS